MDLVSENHRNLGMEHRIDMTNASPSSRHYVTTVNSMFSPAQCGYAQDAFDRRLRLTGLAVGEGLKVEQILLGERQTAAPM